MFWARCGNASRKLTIPTSHHRWTEIKKRVKTTCPIQKRRFHQHKKTEVFGYRLIGIGLTYGHELRKSAKRTGEFRNSPIVTLPTGRVNLRTFLRKMGEKRNEIKRKFVMHFCIPCVTQQTLSVAILKHKQYQYFAKMAIL